MSYDRLPRSVYLARDKGYHYLRGDWRFRGVHRVRNIEAYGREPPALYRPIVRTGLAEVLLEELPETSFDLVYLDPPYGTTDGEWDKAPDWAWLGQAAKRILKEDGQMILHGTGAMAARCLVAFEGVGLRHRFQIVWLKRTLPWTSNQTPLHGHELVHVFSHEGVRVDSLAFNRSAMGAPTKPYEKLRTSEISLHSEYPNERWLTKSAGWLLPCDVIYCEAIRESLGHYAEKPERLVRWLLLGMSKPGGTILDPYAGTGTTLAVGCRLGRRVMGIEASPKSYAILRKRVGPYMKFQEWRLGD